MRSKYVAPLGDRKDLRAALSMYAEHRFAGELADRWDGSTWNLHMGILSAFYKWAVAEGYTAAVPFVEVAEIRCWPMTWLSAWSRTPILKAASERATLRRSTWLRCVGW
ncbi:hypothetical protein AB4305_18060 [Nocardia sp. 2YAB30]|uniref:hypothetical protein n=1 Tax=unclassified Nocardia TaxID=2637762 RepID=UPI003F949540